jgi:superfamily I DNA/RNA helicase
VRVLGGAGTGKSRLLVDTAAAHIAAGTDPESVLLLTGSAKLRAQARAAVTTALLTAGAHGVVREPLVRTVHSYAFAVLRLAAQRAGGPPPRLITSAEQDGIIRELLAGDLEDGAPDWPVELHPALGTAGFATELRDLLARCAERGVDPVALQRLGKLAGQPAWVAAGRFAATYEQVMLLRSAVGMAAPQATVPALAPPSWSAPRWMPLHWTRICWPPNAPGCGCCSSTTPSSWTRRPRCWSGCSPPVPT